MIVVKVYFLKKIQIKTCNTFISRPPRRTSKLQKKPPTLKRVHPALRTIKCTYSLFFFFVGNFCPPGSGSGSSRPKSMRKLIHSMASRQNLLSAGLLFQLPYGSSPSSGFSYGSLNARVRFLAIVTLRHHWKTPAPIFRPHRIESSLAWIGHSLQ